MNERSKWYFTVHRCCTQKLSSLAEAEKKSQDLCVGKSPNRKHPLPKVPRFRVKKPEQWQHCNVWCAVLVFVFSWSLRPWRKLRALSDSGSGRLRSSGGWSAAFRHLPVMIVIFKTRDLFYSAVYYLLALFLYVVQNSVVSEKVNRLTAPTVATNL